MPFYLLRLLQNQATQELIDQGLSLLLPNISAQGSYTDLDNSRKFNTPISNVLIGWRRKQIIKIMNMAL